MKKQVAGFIAGAIFTLSATAFADDIQNLIGKTVQAQYTVEIKGETLNTVVVEGKNYAPVRDIGEAAGFEVVTDGKKVVMKEGIKLDTTAVKEKYRLEKIESLKIAIKNTEQKIDETTKLLNSKKEASVDAISDKDKAAYADFIGQFESTLKQLHDRLAEQNANLTELESQ